MIEEIKESDIQVNINDEYYFREDNICCLISKQGFSGEELKQFILKNQEDAKQLRIYETIIDMNRTIENHEIVERLRKTINHFEEQDDDYCMPLLYEILGEKK